MAVVLQVAAAGLAAAQTVVVRRAPAGSPVEVVVNTATVRTGTADENGDAVLPVNLADAVGSPEAALNILVDVCESMHRVLLLERGVRPPAAGATCDRRDVVGLFRVRPISTLVVNVEGASPTVLLIQGRYSLREAGPSRLWPPAPAGIVLFGNAGLRTFRDARFAACGNLTDCEGGDAAGAYSAGGAYWLWRFLAAEVSFLKPGEAVMRGRGDTFDFTSSLDVRALTLAGLVGVPIGPVRIYGRAGGNRHWGTFSTTQTNQDVTVTIDGEPQTIPGGTQTFELNSGGWGWLFGGGMELWITRGFGLNVEFNRAALRGPAVAGDSLLDEAQTPVLVGARVRIGR
jgi:hypothetical protein